MKWPKEQVDIVVDAFEQYLENSQYTKQEASQEYDKRGIGMLRVMWRGIHYDLTHDDSHEAYWSGSRKRKVKYNPLFVFYPDGCTDDHFWTVLKFVAKKLFSEG